MKPQPSLFCAVLICHFLAPFDMNTPISFLFQMKFLSHCHKEVYLFFFNFYEKEANK